MTKNIEYSIVIPVYNSCQSLKELYKEIDIFFYKLKSSFEVIFVNDFSTDNSWEKLIELKKQNSDKNITIISLTENYGQQKATLCGLENAKGEFIITIDDDLQIHPQEITKLINHQKTENFDIVYGFFYYNKNSVRNIGSNAINKINSKDSISEKYSSFRLIKKSIINRLYFGKHKTNIFIDEMLYWTTGNIGYIQVIHNERKYDNSNYSTKKLITSASNMLLFTTTIPLKLMIYSGFVISTISFLLGIYFIYRKIIHHVPLGYTSIIVTILFSASIIILSLGIIGKYIQELYIQQFEKPPYIIKKIIK